MKGDPMNARRCLVAVLALLAVAVTAVPSGPVQALVVGAPVRISAPLVANRAVVNSVISPDSAYVVYSADANADEVVELFSTPLAGGTVVRLNLPLPTGGDVGFFAISPDSAWVVYSADQTVDGINEVYSVPIGGGTAVRLNAPLVAGGQVAGFVIGAERAVYLADQNVDDAFELFSAPIAGGPATRLNAPLPVLGSVNGYTLSPDGATVVFTGDAVTNDVFQMFSAPIAGGAQAVLSGASGASVPINDFEVSPDSSRVAYIADQNIAGVADLFSVPIGGGSPIVLNTPLPAGGDVNRIEWAPDSSRVAYLADQDVDEVVEAYSVRATGGGLVELNDILPVGDDVDNLQVTSDSQSVVYTAGATAMQLFSVPLTGGTSVRLNSALPVGGTVETFAVSDDASRVVFLADMNVDEVDELFSVPTGGGAPDRLNAAAPNADVGFSFAITPDSTRVLFIADSDVDERLDLYTVPLAGGSRTKLDGALVSGGDVVGVTPAPSSAGLVFTADAMIDGVDELFFVATLPDGASSFTPLSPVRVFDSRPEEVGPGPKGLVPAGGTVQVQIVGVGGVPSGASAVVMNVTAADSVDAGFITVWPTGQQQPLASSINLTGVGQTRPNLVVVPIGDAGKVSMFSQRGAHLIADVTGYFRPAAGAVSAGRIVPLQPARVFDTRADTTAPGPKGLVAGGTAITAQIGGVAGVPANAAAAVLNITATDAVRDGFITVWPTGQPRPLASTLNLAKAGDTSANLVIIPLGAGGGIDLFSQSGAHLLADVTGYVTAAGAVAGTSGLFVPLSPSRVFDTRAAEPGAGPKGFVAEGTTITTQIGGVAGVPADAGLVSLNLTAIDAATGFVTAYPGPDRPLASTLNLNGPLDVRANASFTPIGPTGQLLLFSQRGAQLLADASGYTLP
jgi:Tol biopolymer transport system component